MEQGASSGRGPGLLSCRGDRCEGRKRPPRQWSKWKAPEWLRRSRRPRVATQGQDGGSARPAHFAALDLGTNNCRLLIAQPTQRGFRIVDAYSRIVRLGEGLSQSGRLSEAAMERAFAALGVCADKVRRREPVRLRAIATQACRWRRTARSSWPECASPNRHLAERHQSARRGAALGGGLLQPDRPRGRRGAGAGRRRRLDRAGLARPAPAPRPTPAARRRSRRGSRSRSASSPWPSGSPKATAPAGRRGRLVRARWSRR